MLVLYLGISPKHPEQDEKLLYNYIVKHYCDVHKVYFEYDENGWPDCLTRTQQHRYN